MTQFISDQNGNNRYTIFEDGRIKRTSAPRASVRRKPKSSSAALAYQRRWKTNNPAKKLWYSARLHARAKGVPFTITPDDIRIPEYCEYLDYKLTNTHGRGHVKTNVSIDRIDSSKGYVPGNVQVICNLANRMKTDANAEELVRFALNILRMHKKLAKQLEDEGV